MDTILRKIEKFIPRSLYRFGQPAYHYLLGLLGAIIYRFPARQLYVIGITGTKGKSTTTEIVNAILEEAGYKTACSNTIRFKIANESRPNKYKMSMPGRFFMQKFLRDAVKAGCTHAVLEITSEGSKLYRNRFIPLDAFIFTNIAPEHIESHGSFKNYLEAKLNIARNMKKGVTTIGVINHDDAEHDAFATASAFTKLSSYSLSDAKPLDLSNGVAFRFHKSTIHSPLTGEFNAYNILAAATLADNLGINHDVIRAGIEKLKEVPGRVQKIETGRGFEIVIDYAHTAESLTALYSAFPGKRKICVLGNTGGGRDTWKRPVMARVAEQFCDDIILANEDPYEEDPLTIVREMEAAITKKPVQIILNRREAIHSAISRATPGSVVLITGKGTDPYLMEANNTKTPWSDYAVAKEELAKIK